MILGGTLITQYKTKEEAGPARFRIFQNRSLRKLTGSVEHCGVVPEEDDSVSFYGELVEPAPKSPQKTPRRILSPQGYKNLSPPTSFYD